MSMKKLLALLLAATMVFGLAACKKANNTDPSASANPWDDPYWNVEVDTTGYYVDPETGIVYVGDLTLVDGTAGGGEVGYDVYAGVTGKDWTDPGYYTFNDYMAGMSDLKWSTHTWETNDDDAIRSYITSPFYTFYLNSTKDGWAIAPEMAAALPVDVTDQYVGQYGVKEGDSLKAWKIQLREDLKWENGVAINADTFIYSAKELLDPIMKNRRADSLYAGDFQIYGSKDYVYQGQSSWFAANAVYDTYSADMDGKLVFSLAAPSDNVKAESYVRTSMEFPSSYDAAACADYLIEKYLSGTAFTAAVAAKMEGKTLAEIKADAEMNAAWVALLDWWKPEPNEELHFFITYYTYPEYSWDNVGFLKTGEYELTMIVTAPIENPNYYVPYNLSSTYLVYEPLWESCKKYWDASNKEVSKESDGIVKITTNYCTNKETTMSYGPYKMSYFELDKQYNLVRNDSWYGYQPGQHVGFYQTDEIKVTVIKEHDSAIMAFEKGEIDQVSLEEKDMAKYGSNSNLLYTPQSYTTKISFNTNEESLRAHGTGSQVLANRTLRNALAIAIDRNQYCTSLTAGHLPGFGLLNNLYVYDPFSGATYRDTDGAKQALVELFDLSYGEGGDYETLDEAYESITGYDPEMAKKLMQKAYKECVEEGLYDGTSNITLEFCVYSSDEIYIKIFNFLNEAVKAATKGTQFEGKLELKMKEDADYYNTMYSGNTDVIFTTWGGAAYSPYTMLDQCYCDSSTGEGNQMEYGFDTSKYMVCMVVNGHKITKDLQTWAAWAGGKDVTITSDDGELTLNRFGTYDAATRSNAFSKLEYAFLASYATTSLYYRNAVSVFSTKINYATTTYVDLVAYGGIEFVTYNYTDAEWAARNG